MCWLCIQKNESSDRFCFDHVNPLMWSWCGYTSMWDSLCVWKLLWLMKMDDNNNYWWWWMIKLLLIMMGDNIDDNNNNVWKLLRLMMGDKIDDKIYCVCGNYCDWWRWMIKLLLMKMNDKIIIDEDGW